MKTMWFLLVCVFVLFIGIGITGVFLVQRGHIGTSILGSVCIAVSIFLTVGGLIITVSNMRRGKK